MVPREPTAADRVWNRATGWQDASYVEPNPTQAGDQALVDLLRLHGRAANGGLAAAVDPVDGVDGVEVAAAVAGFRWFGLDDAAAVVLDVAGRARAPELDVDSDAYDGALGDAFEVEADERYWSVADDGLLLAAFKARFAVEPTAFAPLADAWPDGARPPEC